jgi:broad specificity phosphatase PhoE
MKTIYLVRHGESEINVSDVFMDDFSPPLTEVGKEQSRFLAKRAKNLKFEVLIASPFERTKQTAEMIAAETGHGIEFSDLFVERTLPKTLIGRSRTDPEARAVANAAYMSSEQEGEKIDGTESFSEIKERARKALTFLRDRPEENILVVGHGFFTRVLIAHMLYGEKLSGQEFMPLVWGLRTKNTGISVLRYDPADKHRTWWLLAWNDHAHLG